jgi:hypothetical protein
VGGNSAASDTQKRWALELWQAGHLTSRRAIDILDVQDVMDLWAAAGALGVKIRPGLLVREARAAERATAMVRRLMNKQGPEEGEGP